MRDRDRIINQLEKLTSNDEKSWKRTWGISFLTLLVSIMGSITLGIGLVLVWNDNEILPLQPLIQSSRDLPIRSVPHLIERLENEPMTDKRFELLEKNFDSIPSNLSLNQLKDFVDLFLPESYKLNVVRLLRPKVTDNYSDDELEGFKRLFSLHKQSEVEDLLPEREK